MAFDSFLMNMFNRRIQRGLIAAALVLALLVSLGAFTELVGSGIGLWIYRAGLGLSAFWVWRLM